ncbi:hypothetical protein FOZ60_015090 [Perkinsus olseni]|uniref:Secreted protein n=1 Tax=Perkinsus olseni TaxID=32597 RepID=A0A7J6P8E2_PEROL|nr:hypothetical protein FOZ60_015085 [Perkinsus olseni]KAF4691634.1 hypothetical protein FOZ60_015090 [Perkinsus olseni]
MARVTKLLLHLYCLLAAIEYCNASCFGWFTQHDQQEEREYAKVVVYDPVDRTDPDDGPVDAEPRSSHHAPPEEEAVFTHLESALAHDGSGPLFLRRAKAYLNK